MPTNLKDLELDELSLVDNPANKGAKVLLFKRAGAPPTSQEAAMPQLSDVFKAIRKALNPIIGDDTAKAAQVDTAFADAQKALEGAQETDAEKDARAKAEKAQADLAKALDEIAVLKMTDEERACYDKLGDDDKAKFKGMDEKARRAFMLSRKSDTEDGVVKAEQLAAMVAEAVNKALEPVRAENAQLKKALDAATDAISKADEEKDATDLLAKVKATGVVGDHASIVKTLLPLDAAGRDAVLATLKATGAAVKSASLFTEIGGGAAVEGSALGKLDAEVARLQKADPTLSRAAAVTKAVRADPTLYAQYRAEAH